MSSRFEGVRCEESVGRVGWGSDVRGSIWAGEWVM